MSCCCGTAYPQGIPWLIELALNPSRGYILLTRPLGTLELTLCRLQRAQLGNLSNKIARRTTDARFPHILGLFVCLQQDTSHNIGGTSMLFGAATSQLAL